MALPQKKYYRQRAHSNPLADHSFEYPASPTEMRWNAVFPAWNHDQYCVKFLDVGCGYGGLLVSLSPLFPDTLMLGMEIRVKVSDYVKDRIEALQNSHSPLYSNIGVLRTNAMKYLPNYFEKGQLTKLFFLFPDPHFKKTKHKWRVVNSSLVAEYAYFLSPGGMVYTVTDVQALHEWMVDHFKSCPLFEAVPEDALLSDPVLQLLEKSSEEGQKVARSGGTVHRAFFRRIEDPFYLCTITNTELDQ